MPFTAHKQATWLLAAVLLAAGPASSTLAQQVADTTYDTRVVRPAFAADHPSVLLDEAHHNFHTAAGRYRVFADLITHDGCRVTPNREPFSAEVLRGHDVLVISNALGAADMADSAASHPAFTAGECDVVRDWVRAGGALLLIADHAPMGAASRSLAARFGVDMRNAVTMDSAAPAHDEASETLLLFTRENGLLGEHRILRGRDSSERVQRVLTFTGQSLAGPREATALLVLSPTALDLLAPSLPEAMAMSRAAGIPAAGRVQGLAMEFGRGRVVVLGEAAMLSAQLAGPRGMRMGMNRPGNDNRQFALNIMRWLARAL